MYVLEMEFPVADEVPSSGIGHFLDPELQNLTNASLLEFPVD